MKIALGTIIYTLAAVLSGWRFAYVFYEDEPFKMPDGKMLPAETLNKWLRRFAYVCALFWPVSWSVWAVFRIALFALWMIRLIAPKRVERMKNEALKDFSVDEDEK